MQQYNLKNQIGEGIVNARNFTCTFAALKLVFFFGKSVSYIKRVRAWVRFRV